MLVALTAIASFLGAMVASAHAATTNIVRGDSVRREWQRRAVYGAAALLAPWVAYFLIGGLIEFIRR